MAIGKHQDRDAFLTLFEKVAARLKAFAMQSGANSDEAEELVQECLLAVWRKAHTYSPKSGGAITWLYTILRNKRIDFARRGHYDLVLSDDLWPEESGESLENEINSDLEAEYLRTLIGTLPEEQRQVVYKVYFEGKSHSEIARDLDLPVGTIKSRLRLAMKKLDTLAKEQMTWLIIILTTNFY